MLVYGRRHGAAGAAAVRFGAEARDVAFSIFAYARMLRAWPATQPEFSEAARLPRAYGTVTFRLLFDKLRYILAYSELTAGLEVA